MPTTYTQDLAAPLVQVLVAKDSGGDTRYLYGVTRIGEQQSAGWVYHLSDALGSVRQLADANAQVVLARGYTPYGEPLWSEGTGQSAYGYTGEALDSYIKLLFLRARYYSPKTARFLSQDVWQGDYTRSQSLNGWMYVEGNPINYTDPTGQGVDCGLGDPGCKSHFVREGFQYDLTGYLAVAMTAHGQDARIKHIADLNKQRVAEDQLRFWCSPYEMASGIWHPDALVENPFGWTPVEGEFLNAYTQFNDLVGPYKEWDIKRNIEKEIGKGVVFCGETCDWYDYSTPGNIHFGYVASLAEIGHLAAAVAGGILEQMENLFVNGRGIQWGDCNPFPQCDNPQDQAAVDFGFELASRYPSGITEASLRRELTLSWTSQFQRPIDPNFRPPGPAAPQPNHYGPDYFNWV